VDIRVWSSYSLGPNLFPSLIITCLMMLHQSLAMFRIVDTSVEERKHKEPSRGTQEGTVHTQDSQVTVSREPQSKSSHKESTR